MAKQMMEISTSKTVDNNLGNYNSRTFQGKAWTQREYDFENEKGIPGRQYGVRDWSRASLNFEVVKKNDVVTVQPIDHTKPSLQDRWQARIDSGYKATVKTKKGIFRKPIKKTEIKMVMFDFGGNRERMHELAFDRKVNLGKRGIGTNGDVRRLADIEQWAIDCYNYVAAKYGAENIIDFVVHLDETNPHIHCIIVPLTQDGKLSYTELFGGSREQAKARSEQDGHSPNYRKGISDCMLALHTDFAATVGEKWGLERGDDIKITGAVHKSTAESLKEHNRLEDEIASLEDAARLADENLNWKNRSLAKLGMKPVRPTTELEDENERLRRDAEAADKIAHDEREKALAASEKAKTAYSEGIEVGKKQMKESVTAKVKAAKDEVRRDLPAEIRKMANFKAVPNDSPERVAESWRNSYKLKKDAEKALASAMDQLELSDGLLKMLLSIPVISAAVNALRHIFKLAHIAHSGLSEDAVQAINGALSTVDGIENRQRLGKALVSYAVRDYEKYITDYTRGIVEKEVQQVAEGTHKHLSSEQSRGIRL